MNQTPLTVPQMQKLLTFHERAARAYRQYGDTTNAAAAERWAQKMRDQIAQKGAA